MGECRRCWSFHVPASDIEAAVKTEKGRGMWKNATVEQAVQITTDARRFPCVCICHSRVQSEGSGT